MNSESFHADHAWIWYEPSRRFDLKGDYIGVKYDGWLTKEDGYKPNPDGSEKWWKGLEEEDYIIKSPVRRIHKVKTGVQVKEVLTDESLENLRDSCKKKRDLAMIDLLASTGMRVGELVKLNREDVNYNERECIVFGKGNKQRVVYFNARAKIHLQENIKSRRDKNKALFVSLNKPNKRLQVSGVEVRLRKLGKEAKVPRVHPHKFRRTLATMAIDKGMPVEQVQKLLGHVKIDTTMHYAMVNQNNVKLSHRRFLN